MKIVSSNFLWFTYSYGVSSFRDQLRSVQKCLLAEKPDVLVCIEMPSPHEPKNKENLPLLQALESFTRWARQQGFEWIHQGSSDLCVWVLSRKPLLPLLLLGADNLTGAAGKLFKIGPDPNLESSSPTSSGGDRKYYNHSKPEYKKLDGNSDYVDVLNELSAGRYDRSFILGVVDDADDDQEQEKNNKEASSSATASSSSSNKKSTSTQKRRVLPLITVHARCLFWSERFTNACGHFMRAAVGGGKGIIIGDMNMDVTPACKHQINMEDPRLDEIAFTDKVSMERFQRFLTKVPLGQPSEIPEPTCHCITYPYTKLKIDGAFCSHKLDIKVGSTLNEQEKEDDYQIPCFEHTSDHKWITIENVPKQAMIECTARVLNQSDAMHAEKEIFVDAREVTAKWAESHQELFKLVDEGGISFTKVLQPVASHHPPEQKFRLHVEERKSHRFEDEQEQEEETRV